MQSSASEGGAPLAFSAGSHNQVRPMVSNSASRSVRTQYALALCGALVLSACASKYSQVPARLDLAPYGRVALVTFSADKQNEAMTSLATQRFAEALLASQSGIELLELGRADSSLKALPANVDGATLAQTLGRDKNVPAVFLGYLKVSNVKPHGNISASGMNVRAGVTAELTVQLLSTRTGGTVWRSSSAANGTVGKLGISKGLPSIAVRDRDDAYSQVVQDLVAGVTRDLRPTWIKQ